MFLINDRQTKRHKKIRSYLQKEPVIAAILAATDFEWTARRAILALGSSPTKAINDRFKKEKSGGPKAWQKYWKEEVTPRLHEDLADIAPTWQSVVKQAYPLRNKLVHGAEGRVTGSFASLAVDALLAASTSVAEYAEKHGEPVYGRKIRRLKRRP
jgi:hypothetical protein